MENNVNKFVKCCFMSFNRNIYRNHDFSTHEKLETSLEIKSVNQEDGLTNDIVKLRTKFEPMFVLKLIRYPW